MSFGLSNKVTSTTTVLHPSPFSPGSLFTEGEVGAWYDPSDINLAWRRNLLLYSEEFNNWTSFSSADYTLNYAAGPFAGTLSTRFRPSFVTDPGGSDRTLRLYRGISSTAGDRLTFSIYVKPIQTISLYVGNPDGPDVSNDLYIALNADQSSGVSYFNLTTCTWEVVDSDHIAHSENIGDGWYRIGITYSAATTDAVNNHFITFNNRTSQASFDPYPSGDEEAYIWGAQLELGSSPSNYQKITDGVRDYYNYHAQPVLFQDSAGTTPVTAVEQPVGLMLDKSQALVLGSELVTNGTFDTDTDWTKGTGWSISGGVATHAQSAGAGALSQTLALTVGKTYLLTAHISTLDDATISNSSLGIRNAAGTSNLVTIPLSPTSSKLYSGTFVATETNSKAWVYSADDIASVDSLSIRELPGNHAFQSTSASRPTLSARVNLLTKTEDFSDSAWTKTNSTITANAVIAPDGTLTADKIVESAASSSEHGVAVTVTTVSTSTTLSFYAKPAGRSWVWVQIYDSSATQRLASFNIETGALGTIGTNLTASITGVGDGWYRCAVTVSAAFAGGNPIKISATTGNNTPTYTGDGSSGVYIWGADLRVTNDGVGIPSYQRVNTSTDYDTEGFPLYLKFDGADDSLVTNTITPGTDKAQVFAGVRKLIDPAAGAVLAEFSADSSANAGVFAIFAPGSTTPKYGARVRGTVTTASFYTANYPSPTSNIVSLIGNISGDSAIIRVDGTQAASSTADQGTGNFLAYPLYIGRRGGASSPFNGRIYQLITRFGPNLPDWWIRAVERYVNEKTKAY